MKQHPELSYDDAIDLWYLAGRIISANSAKLPPGFGEPWMDKLRELSALCSGKNPQFGLTKIARALKEGPKK